MAGALGRPGYALRSLAVSELAERVIAGVSSERQDRLRRADDDGRDRHAGSPRGTDVLRPSYDMFGDLWLVDRTARGARGAGRRRAGRCASSQVPGVTGADVAAFSVARDGSRLAVAYAGSPAPAVRVTDILRTDEGIVSGAGRSRTFAAGDATRPGSSTSAGATRPRWRS